jgi:hypothetical protein
VLELLDEMCCLFDWEKANPKMVRRRLPPLAGWKPGPPWYLPKGIVEAAKKPGSP